MKSWFGSGKSRTRRVSLDLHYGARTSVWSEISARSHLIVAAVGSASLLGLAGTAIWLALPSDADNRVVSTVQAAPSVDVASAEPAPKAIVPKPATSAAQASSDGGNVLDPLTELGATRSLAPAKAVEPNPQVNETTRKQDAVAEPDGAAPVVQADVAPLDATDPRWVEADPEGGASPAAKSSTKPQAGQDDAVVAYADDATAAIPAAKSVQAAAAKPDDAAADEADEEAAGRPGKTVRSVTMRARPSDRGGVLGTVPGSTAVQVVSCDSWCEIIYNGKRGFVFRRFLVNNGK